MSAPAWMPFDPTRPAMPSAPGVYVIFFDGIAVYVGQSENLKKRLGEHNIRLGYARNFHTPWGAFSQDVVVTGKYRVSRRVGDWAMWEIRLIRRLRPRFNKRGVTIAMRAA